MPELDGNATQLHVRRWRDGSIVGRMTTESHRERISGPYIQVHRADLQQSLLKIALKDGVQVYTKSRVANYDLSRTTRILEDGQETQLDLILAADGESLRSTVKSAHTRLIRHQIDCKAALEWSRILTCDLDRSCRDVSTAGSFFNERSYGNHKLIQRLGFESLVRTAALAILITTMIQSQRSRQDRAIEACSSILEA